MANWVVRTVTGRANKTGRYIVLDAKNKLVGLVTDFDLALLGWEFK